MKVLVTGANGFLGSHVVRKLIDLKFSVRAMVRKGSNRKSIEGISCEFFEGEITNKYDVEKAIMECDYVIHIAARTDQKPTKLETYFNANINSTRYIIDACLKWGVKRFIFVSSAYCFGNGTKENPGNEHKPFMKWLKKSGYAYSKLIAQQMVLHQVKAKKLNAVVVNPTFLIGPNELKTGSPRIFSHVLKKQVVFYPPGGKNFVDAENTALGIVSAMLKGEIGECYLLAGENLSYIEFFKLVVEIANQKSIFIKIPAQLLKIVGWVGDILEKVFRIPVELTGVNAKMLCENNYYTAKKAIYNIDFDKVTVRQSVRKAISSF
jgi:dihydroflavonol-4-reductase